MYLADPYLHYRPRVLRADADHSLQYLFNLPLFFQVVLLDSATTAGARLAIPSLATPIGGLIAGIVMSRWGKLVTLVRVGAFLMVFGNALVTSLGFQDSEWKYNVYIFPANLGQGIVYPGILFTSLATFDHAGKRPEDENCEIARVAHMLLLDHAVTASTVYLVRSLGTVYGVAITSAIVQTTLSVRLPEALGEIADKWRVRPFPPLCRTMCLHNCSCKTGNERDAYTQAKCRSSTRSDTLCPPSERCRPTSSSRHVSSTTTGFVTLLRRRRASLQLQCALRCWPGRGGFEAPSDVMFETLGRY